MDRELGSADRLVRPEHRRMTVAEWVRQTLRNARKEEPQRAVAAKLSALEHPVGYRFPVGDIDTMLGEIEKGCRAGDR